ncbi:kinase-like protein [Anaeromyces robustus]|uniref:non-specific serine/threonine protein kinase n=1 Tax=Anaeromyces robustus TaxID=1754192 RepID=A0A1Y1XQQ1_9FUNG|nr:kinase-like protein [Anaeromyces robustus]|eukprot:ORX88072.1 kinase-like protein [Anaeromyces robustus]
MNENNREIDNENEGNNNKGNKLVIDTAVKKENKRSSSKSPKSEESDKNGYAISPLTIEKTTAAKVYFEQYFDKINKNGPAGRTRRQQQLEEELENKNISNIEKRIIRKAFINKERMHMRSIREKITIDDFEMIKTIGHGAFGIVKLVREKATGEVYATKVLRKSDMIKRHQEMHVRAERDLLSEAAFNANWIIQLMYSFQDDDYLYFVLEFMAGGDLLSLLIKMDIFSEDFAKFYSAEMVMCIEEAHKLGVVHRDIKPDNFLFDARGHIKLSDFGLATDFHWSHNSRFYEFQRQQTLAIAKEFNDAAQNVSNNEKINEELEKELENYSPPKEKILKWRDKNRKKLAYSIVGTQNYTAPEVFLGTGTDQACDWWSLGVIIFEMLYGYPPFCSKDKATTKYKILNWKKTLQLPQTPEVSNKGKNFILSLCCDQKNRLGSRKNEAGEADASDIKNHPWFSDINFETLLDQVPPFHPCLKNDTDSSYFEEIDEEEVKKNWDLHLQQKKKNNNKAETNSEDEMIDMKKKLAFVGFSFKNPYKLNCESLVESNNLTANMSNLSIQERKSSKENIRS